MGRHAVLSASSSHRWTKCTPAARLELEFDDTESSAAAEGTAAHALAEHKLRRALKMRSKKPISPFDCDEMDEYTDAYVDFVLEQLELAKQSCSDPLVLIEQHLDFSKYVPDGFGTGDCILISDKALHIIDLKYGMGILVNAENNSQMMLYSLGALEIYDSLYDIEEVSMTVFQPRIENVNTWTIPVDELRDWAENELKPKAELAFKGGGEYRPGDWCRFCKAKHACRKRAEQNLELAKYEFKLPPLLEDDEIESILGKINDLVSWASDIKDYALQSALSGKHWSGWKLVEGRSNRRYTNDEAVANAVSAAGYDPYEHKVIGITAMEKALGKVRFSELLGDLVEKPQGKPTLVPEGDKRPAIHTAKHDFNDYEEENFNG